MNKRLGQTLVKLASGRALSEQTAALNDAQIKALAALLTGWEIRVTGTQGFEQAQVTAGGIRAEEVLENTMESRKAPGLYLAGEILNIDGDCGGFNLQWAWASGMLAGKSAALSLSGEKA